MAVNKVVYGTTTLVDLTADTVTADKLAEGYTAHDAAGNAIVGTAMMGSGEISITENGTHDVKQYATANVNVQSAPVLLWTNASPTSAMNYGTTVTLPKGYNAYLVEISGQKIFYTPFTTSTTNTFAFSNMNGARFECNGGRAYGAVSDGSIVFYLGYASQSTSSNASYYIPTRIWGIKWAL